MNFFSLGRIVKGLYEDKKELQSALEHMEDELTIEIEALQDENEYLKDELATLRVKDKRLEDEIKTVRERDFKDIYPGLQAENEQLKKDLDAVEETRLKLGRVFLDLCSDRAYKQCDSCTDENREDCPFTKAHNKHFGDEDEVPTETTPEDS